MESFVYRSRLRLDLPLPPGRTSTANVGRTSPHRRCRMLPQRQRESSPMQTETQQQKPREPTVELKLRLPAEVVKDIQERAKRNELTPAELVAEAVRCFRLD